MYIKLDFYRAPKYFARFKTSTIQDTLFCGKGLGFSVQRLRFELGCRVLVLGIGHKVFDRGRGVFR